MIIFFGQCADVASTLVKTSESHRMWMHLVIHVKRSRNMMKLRVAFIYFKVFLNENAAGDLCIFFQSRANKIDQNCMRKRNHIRREDEGEMQERKGNAMESAEKQGKKTTGKAEKAGKN
jgi:hypothetical protein